MNTTLYNEIASTHLFEMEQAAFFKHASLFLTHYRSLSEAERNNRPEQPFLLAASSGFSEKIYLGDAGRISRWEDLDETDVVINVIRFSGPMMRGGGACTYGSIELRDMIIQAANVPQCIGQIFIVDTPGGSSYTKFDFQEALQYAHEKGQQTAMYIDGRCCSAGMAWAALCRKRYARNEHCEFGCMGTYASYYTNKDKDKDAITQEMFHVVYAESCPDKNRWFRESAEGDDTLVQEEVNKSNRQYIDIIRTGIPNVTDEQLKGGTWEAGEVIGTLCDGIRTFEEVVDEMLATRGLAIAPPQSNTNNNENNNEMGKKYENICNTVQDQELQSDNQNAVFLNEEYADRVEAALAQAETDRQQLQEKDTEVSKLNETVNELNGQITKLNAEKDAIQQGKNDTEQTLADREKELNDRIEKLQEEAKSNETKMKELGERITELEAENNALADKPAKQKQPAVLEPEKPARKTEGLVSAQGSVKEQREAYRQRMAELDKRR